jgi:hypothetical protein
VAEWSTPRSSKESGAERLNPTTRLHRSVGGVYARRRCSPGRRIDALKPSTSESRLELGRLDVTTISSGPIDAVGIYEIMPLCVDLADATISQVHP